MRRFVSRLSRLIGEKEKWVEGDGEGPALVALHKTIESVTVDMERYQFNTAIARVMELLNVLQKSEQRGKGALEKMVILLSPMAPHFAEEMWRWLGNSSAVVNEPFPTFDPKLLVEDVVEIAIQILGKVKTRVKVPSGLSSKDQEAFVLGLDEVAQKLEGSDLIKTISVPGRLVNFVVKPKR
jgi:leucyl-tRNA synthetase